MENWQVGRIFEKRLIEAGRTDFGAWTDRSPDFAEAHRPLLRLLAKITRPARCTSNMPPPA
jgi:dihydropyrimidinase/dihydroorotase